MAIGGVVLVVAMYASLWRPQGSFVTSAPDSFFARTFRFNLISLGFALLLPFASNWRVERKNGVSATVQAIAVWSYSMYLVHQPVIQLCHRHVFLEWKTSGWQAIATFSLQVGLTILISAVLFNVYEAPMTRLREKAAPAFARLLRGGKELQPADARDF